MTEQRLSNNLTTAEQQHWKDTKLAEKKHGNKPLRIINNTNYTEKQHINHLYKNIMQPYRKNFVLLHPNIETNNY